MADLERAASIPRMRRKHRSDGGQRSLTLSQHLEVAHSAGSRQVQHCHPVGVAFPLVKVFRVQTPHEQRKTQVAQKASLAQQMDTAPSRIDWPREATAVKSTWAVISCSPMRWYGLPARV